MAENEGLEVEVRDDAPAVMETEENHSPEPKEPAPKKSTREHIKEAMADIKERQNDDKTAKSGKEPAKDAKPEPKKVAEVLPKEGRVPAAKSPHSPNAAAEVKQIDAPVSWAADKKTQFATLPQDVKEYILKRETDMEKKLSSVDEERHFGRKIKDITNPYTPLFAMSNATPEQGIKEMLGYAQILQMGSPQAKGQLLWQLAQRWNADMKFTPQVATRPENQLITTQQEVSKLKDELARLPQTLKQQQEAEQAKQIIEAFASDPKNVHYEKVKPAMASLLTAGIAKDMKDAYDRACYADPEIRPLLISDQQKADAKRIADEKKAKADAARNAASSVRGSGGLNGSQPVSVGKRSLREELQANFRAATQH